MTLKILKVGWYCCDLGASQVVREILLEVRREEMEGAVGRSELGGAKFHRWERWSWDRRHILRFIENHHREARNPRDTHTVGFSATSKFSDGHVLSWRSSRRIVRRYMRRLLRRKCEYWRWFSRIGGVGLGGRSTSIISTCHERFSSKNLMRSACGK